MKYKLILLAISLCLFNCKDETKTKEQSPNQIVDFDYKFPSVQKLIDCEGVDNGIYQEAIQSFEEDLANFYTPGTPVLSRAYSLFVSQAISNKVDYSKMVSDHTKKVLEALKQDKTLWTTNPDGSKVDFSHPIFKCIGENIKDEQLQQTFSALIETNSMSIRMFEGQLKRNTFGMKDDKYLAAYVALELYYGKIYDRDLSKSTETFAKGKSQTEHAAGDGHNH
ncbi:hypothetical protein [Psychroserpens damuponensis]|uniref:hypothetical protein n=1 Tax=Psychroserpens damuponensis TaxID=943936 RepID=UPI00058D4B95|nr:hypothetical protein [Psychroserpens damuponensis]